MKTYAYQMPICIKTTPCREVWVQSTYRKIPYAAGGYSVTGPFIPSDVVLGLRRPAVGSIGRSISERLSELAE